MPNFTWPHSLQKDQSITINITRNRHDCYTIGWVLSDRTGVLDSVIVRKTCKAPGYVLDDVSKIATSALREHLCQQTRPLMQMDNSLRNDDSNVRRDLDKAIDKFWRDRGKE